MTSRQFRLPLLLAALFALDACKSMPEFEPEIIPVEISAEPVPPETARIEEITDESAAVMKAEENTAAEIVIRAEEVIDPSDKNIDVDLVEPVYNFNEPELVNEPALPDEERSAAIVLDEPETREPPAYEMPVDETLAAEEPPETPEQAETLVEGELEEQEEAQEEPPPPPAAALRNSELIDDTPAVPQRTEPIRALPVLSARNPPTETAVPAKPERSRVIYAQAGQTFEVPFQGTGWIYTGEENSMNGISYVSRRINDSTQTFVFRAQKEGEYILKFYKQDFLQDYYTNEYVRVIVSNDRIIADEAIAGVDAPRERPDDLGLEADKLSDEVSAADDTAPAGPEELLQQARDTFNAQKYDEAIALLDKFQQQHPAMSDEAWWLYGQSLENAPLPGRDVRGALEAYSYLTREYPWSKYYKNAQNRIAFLNRFYFNIR
ncbi:MAG: outer membrane protein assembly factor BamD [Spirochaetaceae bacterium]|jgi:hypothetical protein|nr:outer membrane protein assembly factor BamD [Spirochaetaceae bacterium]